ncbi:genetic competence negative regulator [Paenibacillus turpanensis]|uniref:genetic competence negative regulator n=1 Tax=Paenibacillus turpanensis TaxID=2689078 RepID=UPI001407EDFB|nr:genetic competence negative regulator [Paenibacillus turpanensis]
MKMERLSQDKIRIFLTFDDLSDRGIQKDDMWREIPKVHELFSDMMEQAYSELGFDATGPLAVEVFALPAQGMVVIVTRGKPERIHNDDDFEDDLDLPSNVYEMELTIDHNEMITYQFRDFEDTVACAKLLQHHIQAQNTALYSYKEKYFLLLDPDGLEEKEEQKLVAILSEFGDASSVTKAVLEEYGKVVAETKAVEVLCRHF